MKALSLRQALNCETAKEPVCKCRCGGALHGAKRNGNGAYDAAWFEALPDDDPHHMMSKAEKREAFNARKREETRQRNEARMEAWRNMYRPTREF